MDCDVSEKTFSAKHGLAIIPKEDIDPKHALTKGFKEKEITQKYRKTEFMNLTSTDDHLIHITGPLKDPNGMTYYKVKNSWGKTQNRLEIMGIYV